MQLCQSIEKKGLVIYAGDEEIPSFLVNLILILDEKGVKSTFSTLNLSLSPPPPASDSLYIDWANMATSVENALIGKNWVAIYFPENSTISHLKPNLDVAKPLSILHKTIRAMIDVSGKSVRMVAMVDASQEQRFPLDRGWMGNVGNAIRDAAAIYRSQGFPIAVAGIPNHATTPQHHQILAHKIFDLLNNRQAFAPIQVFKL